MGGHAGGRGQEGKVAHCKAQAGRMGNQRGQGTVLDVDLEGRPPLGEARALLVVLLAALGQAVQAAAPLLARPAVEERDEARVDLDARDDVEALRVADGVENVRDGRIIGKRAACVLRPEAIVSQPRLLLA